MPSAAGSSRSPLTCSVVLPSGERDRPPPGRWKALLIGTIGSVPQAAPQRRVDGAHRETVGAIVWITDGSQLYEVLDEVACRHLLGARGVGRLAFTQEALPAIQPVPYVVHDGEVAFRIRAGSPMAAALDGSVVAFEVDSCAAGVSAWWLVTAIGHARLVSDPWDIATLGALAGTPSGNVDDCYVMVSLQILRGWRTVAEVPRASRAAG